MKAFAVFLLCALTTSPASADDLCTALSDVSAKLKADASPTRLETIRNLSGYMTERLQGLDTINKCAEDFASVSFSCTLSNASARTDAKPKPSPGFQATDVTLRKCFSSIKDKDHMPDPFQKTYSLRNDRFDLVLYQIEGPMVVNVVRIAANPREYKPDNEDTEQPKVKN